MKVCQCGCHILLTHLWIELESMVSVLLLLEPFLHILTFEQNAN